MIRYEVDWQKLPSEQLKLDIYATTRLRFWRFEAFSLNEDFEIALYAFWGKLRVWPRVSKASEEALVPESEYEELDVPSEDKQGLNPTKDTEKERATKSRKKGSIYSRKLQQLRSDEAQVAYSFIIGKLCWFLKKSMPKELRGNLEFSLGDPANTGLTTGLISLCPAAYGKRLSITPDFTSEEIYATGKLHLKGIVFYRHLVYLIFSIAFNKDCKRLFAKLR